MAQRGIITLTEKAKHRIRHLMKDAPHAKALKIGVRNGGCVGVSYTLDFVEAPEPTDEVFQQGDIALYIDAKALLFLLGTEMDFQEDELSSGFVFNNPNQLSACGCGESVALQAVPAEVLHEALAAR